MSYSGYDTTKVKLHVVASKAFILGSSFLVSAVLLWQTFNMSLFSTRAYIYIISTSIFYMLEFMTTAIYNNEAVDDDSFILNDIELHAVHVASLVESWFVHKSLKYHQFAFWTGLATILASQFCRTWSMYTAGTSFNHYVQKEKSQKHVLVQNGIYSIFRHPSYFGFFWWFVGCQFLLQNFVTGFIGGYKLQRFFEARIEYEEQFLESFFGDSYRNYRARTKTWIPFIA